MQSQIFARLTSALRTVTSVTVSPTRGSTSRLSATLDRTTSEFAVASTMENANFCNISNYLMGPTPGVRGKPAPPFAALLTDRAPLPWLCRGALLGATRRNHFRTRPPSGMRAARRAPDASHALGSSPVAFT